MSRNTWWAKTLRIVGIVFMSLTAAFTLMGGAGTSCVALNPTGFGDTFAPLAQVQWLYILFVLLGVAIGIMGVRAVILLVKGTKNAYRCTLIALVAGILVGGIHMAVSRALRGSSMPVDAVIYTTVLTLTIQFIMAPTHTIGGVNYADVWHVALTLIGGGLLIAGALSLFWPRFIAARREALADGWIQI